MTRADYESSTKERLGRAIQYIIFPATWLLGASLFKDRNKANNFARVSSAGAYAAITSTFFGRETTTLDLNARDAVAAELGIEPKDLQFTDYWKSNNSVVQREVADLMHAQKLRYASDATFLAPIAVNAAGKAAGVKNVPRFGKVREHPENYTGLQRLVSETPLWDSGVFGVHSAYWAYETYGMDKTAHYEIVKLRETVESTGKDVSYNNILPIIQRSRSDKGLPQLNREEREAMRPLINQLVDYCNASEKFGVSEIVYLIGMDKVRIHGEDGKTISQEAIAQSAREIQHVCEVGLEGIGRENRAKRMQHTAPMGGDGASLMEGGHADKYLKNKPVPFEAHVAETAFNTWQSLTGGPKTFEFKEYLSPRDPTHPVLNGGRMR